jgi:DNA-binding NtrC family response regulator
MTGKIGTAAILSGSDFPTIAEQGNMGTAPIFPRVVLIVDDEPDMCWALERIIARMGYQTVSAPSGQDAARLVERIPVEMALVDAKLPDMEGIDLARQLRQRQPGLPVVLVSGYFYELDARVQEWIRQEVIWGFIGKPFVLSQVRKAVETALARPVHDLTAATRTISSAPPPAC